MKNKTIYNLGLLVFLLCTVGICSAQTENGEPVAIPLSSPGEDGQLKLNLLYGSITVMAHNGKDVIIETVGGKGKKPGKMKDGMRRIGDTSLEYSVEEYNNEVVVKSKKHNKRVRF